VEVSLHSNSTQEASKSTDQVRRALDECLAERARRHPGFQKILKLMISADLMHPFAGGQSQRDRRGYSKKCRLYSVQTYLDYVPWAAGGWDDRVRQFAENLERAIRLVPSARMLDAERALLLREVEEARSAVSAAVPADVAPLGAISVVYWQGDDKPPMISFGSVRAPAAGRVVEILPSAVGTIRREQFFPAASQQETLFKLYRTVDGRRCYREAWVNGTKVMEHWGVCGERGEVRTHQVGHDHTAQGILQALKAQARALGFRPIPAGRRCVLVIEYDLESAASCGNLKPRHVVEDLLDQELGWLGLGHCDGGSAGSGTMEVFCPVIDFALARDAVAHALAGSPFADYRRIFRQPRG
jgi:hypothetical protein